MKTKFIKIALDDFEFQNNHLYSFITGNGNIFNDRYFDYVEFSEYKERYTHVLKEVPDKESELVELSRNEGILIGLGICKAMWAQGTISHETISENEKYYNDEYDSLVETINNK